MTPATGKDFRHRALARIHLAKKELRMDDSIYRAMLHEIGGVGSSKDLDAAGLNRVLDHLTRCGFEGKSSYPGRPRNFADEDRGPLLRKIEALLTAGKKSWKYGDSIALRVCGIAKVAWCRPGELHKVAGVLASNAAKYGWEKEKAKQAK
jgi:phage gp16-like protein